MARNKTAHNCDSTWNCNAHIACMASGWCVCRVGVKAGAAQVLYRSPPTAAAAAAAAVTAVAAAAVDFAAVICSFAAPAAVLMLWLFALSLFLVAAPLLHLLLKPHCVQVWVVPFGVTCLVTSPGCFGGPVRSKEHHCTKHICSISSHAVAVMA